MLRIVRELPSPLNVRKLSLHVRRMTCVEIDTHRQVFAGKSQRVTKLLLAQLIAALGDLLFELLLNVGREIGYLHHLADFNHFVIRAGDA